MQPVALYCQVKTVYKDLGIDYYNAERNALSFVGNNPVICHPPCRAWGQLKHFAQPEPGEKELAFHALNKIWENGGILEHPYKTSLWKVAGLPYPNQGKDVYGGFSISINQSWFGHPCEKKTLLYICGCELSDLPAYPISFNAIEYVVSSTKTGRHAMFGKKEASKYWREKTPEALAQWLIDVCNIIEQKKLLRHSCRAGGLVIGM